MELPEIGKQCEHVDCNRLDFLPVNCVCGKKFCMEHFNQHTLECSSIRNNTKIEYSTKTASKTYICSELNCNVFDLVPLICEKCNQHFCIKHRHISECEPPDPQNKKEAIDKMKAPVDKFNSAKAIVDEEIDKKIGALRKKSKNSGMAEKLMLLRLKNKAVGLKSIPEIDRVYFNVHHPGRGGVTPVYVSKTWSVGKTIDAIANECKISNKNNTSTSLKLRLFKLESGESIASSVAVVINKLIDDKYLMNAENLVLEYVKEDCTKIDI